MNSKQRRQKRRRFEPVMKKFIKGLEILAEAMRKTGQTMTPEDCEALARELKEQRSSNSW